MARLPVGPTALRVRAQGKRARQRAQRGVGEHVAHEQISLDELASRGLAGTARIGVRRVPGGGHDPLRALGICFAKPLEQARVSAGAVFVERVGRALDRLGAGLLECQAAIRVLRPALETAPVDLERGP